MGRTAVFSKWPARKDKKMWRTLSSYVTFLALILLPTLAVRAQEVQVEIAQPPMPFLNG